MGIIGGEKHVFMFLAAAGDEGIDVRSMETGILDGTEVSVGGKRRGF